MSKEKRAAIFVTGGWDSTFMFCKLSRLPITIEPIYVSNKERKSREYEMKAIDKTFHSLIKHPATKAKILPIKIIELNNIEIDQSIRKARRNLKKKTGLGYQYDYLATIAKDLGPVGVGIENSPPEGDTGETAILTRLAKLIPGPYGQIVEQKNSDSDVNTVFGNMFFPIADITEPEMQDWAKKNGYDDIMHSTWFCHSPINGSPCGLCPPCEEKMGSEMGFLLPEEAKKRYYKAKKWDFLGEKLSRPIKRWKIKRLTKQRHR